MKYLLIFLLIPVCAHSQIDHFEGIINYKINYESLEPGINLEQYMTYFGDSSIVFIKPGKYKQVYKNSTGIDFVQYDYKTNFYYFKLFGIDTLYYLDCGKEKENYEFSEMDSVVTILNYKCKLIILNSFS